MSPQQEALSSPGHYRHAVTHDHSAPALTALQGYDSAPDSAASPPGADGDDSSSSASLTASSAADSDPELRAELETENASLKAEKAALEQQLAERKAAQAARAGSFGVAHALQHFFPKGLGKLDPKSLWGQPCAETSDGAADTGSPHWHSNAEVASAQSTSPQSEHSVQPQRDTSQQLGESSTVVQGSANEQHGTETKAGGPSRQPVQGSRGQASTLRVAVPDFLPHKFRAGHAANLHNFEKVYKAAYMETYGPALEDHGKLEAELAKLVQASALTRVLD